MPDRRSRRARALAATGLVCVVAAVAAAAALGAASKPLVLRDAGKDVSGALDVTRVSLRRASDGRVRAVVTFARKVSARTLLASSGPPGSACLRIWTDFDADPAATRPDRLACVTARSSQELRGGVYELTGAGLPERVAGASVALTRSRRSVVIRFAQSSLGRPSRIRFAVEATRPGCARTSCVDRVPDSGRARAFRLR